jgi:hypothetical protein
MISIFGHFNADSRRQPSNRTAFTHPYHAGYGGPEIEQHKPSMKAVSLPQDGLSAKVAVDKLQPGFVYELDLQRLRSRDQDELLHRNAFYTVNEIPARKPRR